MAQGSNVESPAPDPETISNKDQTQVYSDEPDMEPAPKDQNAMDVDGKGNRSVNEDGQQQYGEGRAKHQVGLQFGIGGHNEIRHGRRLPSRKTVRI